MEEEWSVADRVFLDEEKEQLRRVLGRAADQIREENRLVLEERERLYVVEKDREVLDRLRQKKQEEYLRELMKHEQLEMDETVVQRHGKGRAA
jgi:flagellar biosynthesis chaperone FliJ